MAEICCKVIGESEASSSCEPSSRVARRRRMEIRRCKFVAGVAPSETDTVAKRQKLEDRSASISRDCDNAVENCDSGEEETVGRFVAGEVPKEVSTPLHRESPIIPLGGEIPKFGFSSVCGRRRDMEDAVAVHPSLCFTDKEATDKLHLFGVYDGHGCSHVAMRCKDRLHELVKEELDREVKEEASAAAEASRWDGAMKRIFRRMDNEVVARNNEEIVVANCRCELQSPDCDAVGSTAVVAVVTANKIIVANCGDSRAVLCRNGKAVPLSSDHKPDRPDELNRIEEAGGRVIYWDGPRVLGVLAMSRAIGDNYLKPYVISEPEVTITDRTAEDECLILASDGLWDVVPNETACGVASMCLRGKTEARSPGSPPVAVETAVERVGTERADKACNDASILLTKLALARHSTDNVSVVVVDLKRDT
ncbi:Protein phosphatase 2C 3, partial [Cucurbita argyrosperma subsp. sororia]